MQSRAVALPVGASHCRRLEAVHCLAERESAGPPPVHVNIPPPRKSTLEPTAVPVVHSPAYFLQREEQNLLVEVTEGRDVGEMEVGRSFEEDPVEWMLTSTDQMLNEMEKNPDSTTEAIWKISNSPIGKGAAAGVRTAAKLTIKAGQEAVKMAAPVGSWALKEGITAVTKILKESKKK